jgi:hypothetical protein
MYLTVSWSLRQDSRHVQCPLMEGTPMRSIQKATALAGALVIFAALAAYGGLGAMVPVARSSLTAAATSWTLTTADSRLPSNVRVEPVSATASDEEAARYQTCNLFRQMVDGIDYLSTDEQQQLISDMADVVQGTGDLDLQEAVANVSQGLLDSNPQQFALGMRTLSKICGVPYE